ncbi:MAG: PHP domain-containing protein, partial [Clostridia bacterium]|nr:PHP domain-containing protein [Clostridia bacterium]
EYSPESIVEMAKEAGINKIAITDHNSVKGVEPAILKGKEIGVEVIPGIEMDCHYNGLNLHLLGYYIDYKNHKFEDLEKNIFDQEMSFATTKINKLRAGTDLNIDENKIFEIANGSIITGELIAQVLMDDPSNRDNILLKPYFCGGDRSDMPYVNFYWDYFAQGKMAYVPIEYMTFNEGIELVKETGGIPIIAHPGNNLKDDLSMINHLIREGLEGIEAYSSYHTKEATDYFLTVAKKNGLRITYGSDFHGEHKPNIRLGELDYEIDFDEIL